MSRDALRRQAIADAVIPALDAGVAQLPEHMTLGEWLRDINLSPAPRRELAIRTCLLCSGQFPPVSSGDNVCEFCRAGVRRRPA